MDWLQDKIVEIYNAVGAWFLENEGWQAHLTETFTKWLADLFNTLVDAVTPA